MASGGRAHHKLALKHLVIGDVTGYGSMSEADVVNFSRTVVPHFFLLGAQHRCAHLETIGDAILGVFDEFADAARFALDVRDYFIRKQWGDAQINPDPVSIGGDAQMRIALHSGKIFVRAQRDAQPPVYGAEISRTARIEPVVMPNQVFMSSEAKVHFDEATKGTKLQLVAENLGECRLPKEHRLQRLYWLGRSKREWPSSTSGPDKSAQRALRSKASRREARGSGQTAIRPRASTISYFDARAGVDEFLRREVDARLALNNPIRRVRWLGFNSATTFPTWWGILERGLARGFEWEICVWDQRSSNIPPNLDRAATTNAPEVRVISDEWRALQSEIERLHEHLAANAIYDAQLGYAHIAELCCEYLLLASVILAFPSRHADEIGGRGNLVKRIDFDGTPKAGALGGRISLRKSPLYVPARILFVDDLVFMSMYLHGGRVGPVMMASEHSELYARLDGHFEAAWGISSMVHEVTGGRFSHN